MSEKWISDFFDSIFKKCMIENCLILIHLKKQSF